VNVLEAMFDEGFEVLVTNAANFDINELLKTKDLLDVCRETWRPSVVIPLDPSGQVPPVVPDEGLQDFWWEVKQLRP
jgi:hypothetical protein